MLFRSGTAAAVAAGVVGVIGTVLAVVEHNNAETQMSEQMISGREEPKTEALPEPAKETIPEATVKQEVSVASES